LDSYYDLPKEHPDIKIWDDIFWEYMEEKGLSLRFKMQLELEERIVNFEIQKALEQTNKYNGKIAETKQKLKTYKGKKSNQKFSERLAIINKSQGYQLNTRQTTVYEFIGIEKILEEEAEKAKKPNRKHR
jgi:hypothetical protein